MAEKIPEIVLASQSARRREILEHLGIPFRVCVSNADENIDKNLDAGKYTEELSKIKGKAVLQKVKENELIIASDTVVFCENQILGKPKDKNDAINMIKLLSGKTHKVVSGIAVFYKGRIYTDHDETEVTFRTLEDDEILNYVESGEPYDKAGGYGIQDRAAIFISNINGDYFNVVGLPVYKLFALLKNKLSIDYFDLNPNKTNN